MARARTDLERRPDPDALLALAGEGEGRLRVFLGAAPGVGKTYAMLSARPRGESRRRRHVVIGLVETHGRSETEALLEGLEVLPRRRIDYRGRTIEEFDIDAALARKPKLILVDELAHTNAPDSRHPKRWQDVEELLDAGVDVWTTLNIQHLESLADVVSRITGVAVRETVPDRLLRGCADSVLVDITPDELLERLAQGKVYVADMAARAQQNFFTPAISPRLRELALRRTAERVDDDMVDYLRQGAIEGPWETSERLLALVGPDAWGERLVRTAAPAGDRPQRVLDRALHRAGHEEGDPPKAQKHRRYASPRRSLGGGGRAAHRRGHGGRSPQVRAPENITQIVVGRSRGEFPRALTAFARRRIGPAFAKHRRPRA